jgi:hypothetical protein
MEPCPAGTDQVTAVLDEPVTVAVNVWVPLGNRLAVLGEMETATTGVALTVTSHAAYLELSAALAAVIVAEPTDTPRTRPVPVTVATDASLLAQ